VEVCGQTNPQSFLWGVWRKMVLPEKWIVLSS
jgi:hypothetical protein